MNLSTNAQRATREWASRPNDERYTSLLDMREHFAHQKANSRQAIVSSRQIELQPHEDNGLKLVGPSGNGFEPNHWSFGQLSTLAGAPAGYLRKLPSPMACDCINYGLKVDRPIEDIGVLLHRNDRNILRAATGPNYGRVWNLDVVEALIQRFGNGADGEWRVPGEFGKRLAEVTKANTTLYASDRDMFVFLANEDRRIEIAGRSLARGFYLWNSEVGAATIGLGIFLFDFVCQNRIVWGQQDYKEFKIRHTVSAPDRFLAELQPALRRYSESSDSNIIQAVEDASKDKLADVNEFLAKRFGPRMVESIKRVHVLEENRPIETRFDVVVGVTAYAKGIEHQDSRVDLERQAGLLLAS
jgi:hypothetical protein